MAPAGASAAVRCVSHVGLLATLSAGASTTGRAVLTLDAIIDRYRAAHQRYNEALDAHTAAQDTLTRRRAEVEEASNAYSEAIREYHDAIEAYAIESGKPLPPSYDGRDLRGSLYG